MASPTGFGAPTQPAPSGFKRWLILVLAIGAAMRLVALDRESLWADELASIQFAGEPLGQLWSGWMVNETNPPLYYSLLHYWVQAFGASEFGMRSLSVLGGLGVIGLAYALAKRAGSPFVGVLAAGLVALSSAQIAFSQEARAAIFTGASALLALWGALRFADAAQPRDALGNDASLVPGLWWYFVGCSAALYFHTTMFALPLVANAFVLLRAGMGRLSRCALVAWIIVNIACLLAWAWWIHITLLQLSGPASSNIAWMSVPGWQDFAKAVGRMYGLSGSGPVAASAAFVAFATVVVPYVWRTRGSTATQLLAIACVVTPCLLWLLSQRTPVFLERTILWAQAPWLILLAAGLASVRRDRLRLALTLLAVGAMAVDATLYLQHNAKEPWRQAIETIKTHAQPGDVIMVTAPSYGGAVMHYTARSGLTIPVLALDRQRRDGRWALDTFTGKMVRPQDLLATLEKYRRVWVVKRAIDTDNPLDQTPAQLVDQQSVSRGVAPPILLHLYEVPGEGKRP